MHLISGVFTRGLMLLVIGRFSLHVLVGGVELLRLLLLLKLFSTDDLQMIVVLNSNLSRIGDATIRFNDYDLAITAVLFLVFSSVKHHGLLIFCTVLIVFHDLLSLV